ncbi:MAG: hypothetical protein KA248_08230 [Kiritimatiellae bacterium]|nr:hypothetical protein [Kiritimatiellia bacterium]
MKRTACIALGLVAALVPLVLYSLCGCEVGSADSVVRMLGIDFSGFYQGTGANGTGMVSPPNSGDEVTLLNLRQNGDQLEAVDNNGIVFRGTLGNLVDTTASFTLEGRTTIGRSVTISGTLNGEGTDGTMRGTWIEPNQYSTLYAVGTINPSPTGVVGEITISPDGDTLYSNQNSRVFTCNDTGSSPFTWTVGNSSRGGVSPGTGTSVTYTRTASGDNTLTVTDAAGRTDTVTIFQPSSSTNTTDNGSSTNGTGNGTSTNGNGNGSSTNGPPAPGGAAIRFIYTRGGPSA